VLELQSLSIRLGVFRVVDLSLTVGEGEYFVLLGSSGSGKTVLLELVAGLLRPDSGCVRWQGRDVTDAPPEARGFALVYQDYALFPHMTVEKNIAYGLRSRRVDRRESDRRIASVAKKLSIAPLLHRLPGRLSGGEKQRVALARALVTKPAVLLLDEPLASLDTDVRLTLIEELKSIHREAGTTFLHVTHDTGEAVYLGGCAAVLRDGQVIRQGAPSELFADSTACQIPAALPQTGAASEPAAAG